MALTKIFFCFFVLLIVTNAQVFDFGNMHQEFTTCTSLENIEIMEESSWRIKEAGMFPGGPKSGFVLTMDSPGCVQLVRSVSVSRGSFLELEAWITKGHLSVWLVGESRKRKKVVEVAGSGWIRRVVELHPDTVENDYKVQVSSRNGSVSLRFLAVHQSRPILLDLERESSTLKTSERPFPTVNPSTTERPIPTNSAPIKTTERWSPTTPMTTSSSSTVTDPITTERFTSVSTEDPTNTVSTTTQTSPTDSTTKTTNNLNSTTPASTDPTTDQTTPNQITTTNHPSSELTTSEDNTTNDLTSEDPSLTSTPPPPGYSSKFSVWGFVVGFVSAAVILIIIVILIWWLCLAVAKKKSRNKRRDSQIVVLPRLEIVSETNDSKSNVSIVGKDYAVLRKKQSESVTKD